VARLDVQSPGPPVANHVGHNVDAHNWLRIDDRRVGQRRGWEAMTGGCPSTSVRISDDATKRALVRTSDGLTGASREVKRYVGLFRCRPVSLVCLVLDEIDGIDQRDRIDQTDQTDE
jgi:hypothetical protein